MRFFHRQTYLPEVERSLLELRTHFAFVASKKRIIIDGEDFYLALPLFRRRLQCLVNVKLKIGKFQAEHKGKMELYLRWLDKYKRLPHENALLGLLLCTEARAEHIELLQLMTSGIHITEYLTELSPRGFLHSHLQKATRLSQARFLSETEEEKK